MKKLTGSINKLQLAEEAHQAMKAARVDIDKAAELYLELKDRIWSLEANLYKLNPYHDLKVAELMQEATDCTARIRERLNACEIGSFKISLIKDDGLIQAAYRALP